MGNKYNNLKEGNARSGAHRDRPRFFTAKKVITFSVIIAIALFGAVDIFVDPPAWWRFERQQDKKAILDYVRNNYPDAFERKRGQFPLQMPAGPHKFSVMHFELDGINFHVGAEYGKVIFDCYPDAKATAQFDKIIFDGFMKPRNLNAGIKYTFKDDYEGNSPYIGGLDIEITIIDQGSTPREVGWIYDFYKFWSNEGDFLKEYRVDIFVYSGNEEKAHLVFFNDSEFADENEFYAAIYD